MIPLKWKSNIYNKHLSKLQEIQTQYIMDFKVHLKQHSQMQ